MTWNFEKWGLKSGSVPRGAVVATSTAKRPVSSRYFFIILVVSGQFLWLFWPSTIRALSDWACAVSGKMRSAARRRERNIWWLREGEEWARRSGGDEWVD